MAAMAEVNMPLSAMARPENVPAISLTWKARAVPMPCDVRPAANPRAA